MDHQVPPHTLLVVLVSARQLLLVLGAAGSAICSWARESGQSGITSPLHSISPSPSPPAYVPCPAWRPGLPCRPARQQVKFHCIGRSAPDFCTAALLVWCLHGVGVLSALCCFPAASQSRQQRRADRVPLVSSASAMDRLRWASTFFDLDPDL